MTNEEKQETVRAALEDMLRHVEGAFDAFNKRIETEMPGAYITVLPEVRVRVERIEGALVAAREYLKDQTRAIAPWLNKVNTP